MNRYRVRIVLSFLVVSALACRDFDLRRLGRKPAPTPTTCEGGSEATEKDVAYALAYTGTALGGSQWRRSHEAGNQRASVTWSNDAEGAIAHLEYLVYSCGYTPADVHEYFSPQNLRDVHFRDYQEPVQTATCATETGIKLYELTVSYEGRPYLARYWRALDSRTRIVTLLMTFPAEAKESFERHSSALFPALPRCGR
jgi:hypothetical protein